MEQNDSPYFKNGILSKNTNKDEVLKLSEGCRWCKTCCAKTAGFILEEEIPRIASHLHITESECKEKFLHEKKIFNKKIWQPNLKGKPFGPCTFWKDEIGCTIHPVKQMHCRVGGHHIHAEETVQWYFLNYLIDPDDPDAIREYASYLRHNKSIPGGLLSDLVPNNNRLQSILNLTIR